MITLRGVIRLGNRLDGRDRLSESRVFGLSMMDRQRQRIDHW